MSEKIIIDISHHHKVTDWKALKENVAFLIFKATQGTSFVDPDCASNIKNCERYNISYWLYTFLNKDNELAQAKFMVSKFKDKVGKNFMGWCLDAEYGNSPSGVQKALDYIKTQSTKTMIYTAHQYHYLYKRLLAKRGPDCAWWEPRYSSKGPHDGCDLWQYTDAYRCSYLTGKIDANYLMGSKPMSWFTTASQMARKVVDKKETVKMDTEIETREKVANWLEPYVGIKEGSTEHKQILAVFNNSGLCSRYKMTTGDAWCAAAVSAAFIACGLAGKPGSGSVCEFVECSCRAMVEKAKKLGIWVEDDGYTPKVGDVILYDWQDSGKGDNKGHPDHVGIICQAGIKSFQVIEGNKNDSIGYRTMMVGGKYIRGFICPKYDGTTKPNNTGPSKTAKWTGRVTAAALNVRSWAGKEYPNIKSHPILYKNDKVDICDSIKTSTGDTWYYVRIDGKVYGFVSGRYIV